MSKYIDADQICAEIGRQKEINKRLLDGQLREGCLYAFNQVIAFLDTLPEQPDKYNRALEKARRWMPNMNQGGQEILIDIFPELGENLDPRYGLPEQPASEGLEEEIATWIPERVRGEEGEIKTAVIEWSKAVARHFAEWGRKQVLQEIYEGKVKPVDKITAAWLDDESKVKEDK